VVVLVALAARWAAALDELVESEMSAALIQELDAELEKAAQLAQDWQPVLRQLQEEAQSFSYAYEDVSTDAPTAGPTAVGAPTEEPTVAPTAAPSPVPTSFPTVDCGDNITMAVIFGPDADDRDDLWGDSLATLLATPLPDEGEAPDGSLAELAAAFTPSESLYESFCLSPLKCYMLTVNITDDVTSSDLFVLIRSPQSSLQGSIDPAGDDFDLVFCMDEVGTFNRAPSAAPTPVPSSEPTFAPSGLPTMAPTATVAPTSLPTLTPSSSPTPAPTREVMDILIEFFVDFPGFASIGVAPGEMIAELYAICADRGYAYALEQVVEEFYSTDVGLSLSDSDLLDVLCNITRTTVDYRAAFDCLLQMHRETAQQDPNGPITTRETEDNLLEEISEETSGSNSDDFIDLVIEGIENDDDSTCSDNLNDRRRLAEPHRLGNVVAPSELVARRLQGDFNILSVINGSSVLNITVDAETSMPTSVPTAVPTVEPSFVPTEQPTDTETFPPTTTPQPSSSPAPTGLVCSTNYDCPEGKVCQTDARRGRTRALLYGFYTGICVDE